MKNALIAFAIVASFVATGAAGAAVYIGGHQSANSGQALGAPEFNVLSGATTAASSTVATSDTTVVATSTSRRYLVIVNDGPAAVYLNFGTPAIKGKGILLNANGGSFEVNAQNLFTGAVHAIASSTPSNITYIQVQ